MDIIEILKAVLLGVVQGITEWLPISSTGHMLLVDELLPLNMTEAFKEMFFVVVQLGSILAVVVLYFRKLNPFALSKTPRERRDTVSMWLKVLVGILPAGVIGILFDDKIHELFYNSWTIAATLIIYGVLFIVIENWGKNQRPRITGFRELTYPMALLIGGFQVLALIPGTSRSGATILGAMLLGASRFVAAEYSFFLAIPVMFGASFLKIIKFGFDFTTPEWVILLVGMAVAFVVSVLAIKFLMGYIKKHDFKAFGWYRIILGVIIILYFTFIAK